MNSITREERPIDLSLGVPEIFICNIESETPCTLSSQIIIQFQETKLKERLDALDKELQSLHVQVTSKCTQGEKKVRTRAIKDQRAEHNVNSSQLKSKTNVTKKEYEDIGFFQEDCKKYLQSISKNVAKGSEAIHKIASLTEISNITGNTDIIDSLASAFSTNIKDGASTHLSSLRNEEVKQKKKSDFVANKRNLQSITKTQYDPFVSDVEKILQKLQKANHRQDNPSCAPTKISYESDVPEKLVNEGVSLLHLKEKLDSIQKKLSEEKAKRENAEKAIAGYIRRLAALEVKTSGKEKKKGNEEESDSWETLKKELEMERKKRKEADKKIKDLEANLEDSKAKIEKHDDCKKWAMAMAETIHAKTCQFNQKELEKVRKENHNLEKQLFYYQEKIQEDPVLIESLMQRAELAERELIEKMKQCNELMTRNSVNDPEVQELLERHKRSYEELRQEKMYKEAELQNQNAVLKNELDLIKSQSQQKYEKLREKYCKTLKEFHGKNLGLQSEKSTFENEIQGLKERLLEVSQMNEKQETIIKELKEKLITNCQELKKLNLEYEENKRLLQSSIEKNAKGFHETITQKENIIASLRKEVDNYKDTLLIKEQMLKDQIDTIKCLRTVSDNTKRALDDEREQKQKLQREVNKLISSEKFFEKKLFYYEKQLKEEQLSSSLQQKNKDSFKATENQLSNRLREMEKTLSQMSYERDQAIQTARFATEKLIQAINDYESKMSVQKRLYSILNEAYKEKDFQLQAANLQLNELNEELWASARNTEEMKKDLQTQLLNACEVCADAICAQFENEF